MPTLLDPEPKGRDAWAFPLDATLGVEGIPQSGTGQVALLTGANAPRLYGRHFGPWTPVRLRPLLARGNVLSLGRESGWDVVFANAYPRGYLESRRGRRPAAPPLAAHAAGALTRHQEALGRGEAVASEILNTGWRRYLGYEDLPDLGEEDAGRNLGRIAGKVDLTVYAHYATDVAGHRGGMSGAVQSLERVDRFLEGVLETFPPEGALVIASDHGNVEDVRGGHTRNPARGVARGEALERAEVSAPGSIMEVPRLLGLTPTNSPSLV